MNAPLANASRSSSLLPWRLLAVAGATALALLLLLLFVVPRLIPSGWLGPRLEQLLSQALGTPVHVASAHATSFLPLTIVVENVTLGQHHPEVRLTGTIRQGEFGIGWFDLLRRRPTFTHLRLTEADLHLPASTPSGAGPASRSQLYPKLAKHALPNSQHEPLRRAHPRPAMMWRTAAAMSDDAMTFTIEQLTVNDSRLSWIDTPFQFEHLNTEGRVQGREVALRQTTANWLDGTIEASAIRLTFAPEWLGFAITGRLTNIATEKLASPPETAAVTGQGTFRLDIAGQYRYETQQFEALSGSGDGDLREGHFPHLRPGAIGRTLTMPPLLPSFGGLDLGALSEHLLGTSSAPLPTNQGLSFREIAFRFALAGTTVKLNGLTCSLEEDRQITGQGVISLAKRPVQIDFDLRFPLNFVTGRRLGGLPLLGTLSEQQMIPVRVTGSFERPVVEIIRLSM